MPHDDLVRMWPAAGVSARAGDLELRWIDDDLLADLAAVAARGVHAPEARPFATDWTRGTPQDVSRSVLQFQWRTRAEVSPEKWVLEFGVIHAGAPVGVQSLVAEQWPVLRRVDSGSWLGREFQGRGIGKRMRALVLHLAFAGLEAAEATSGAFVDNASSNAVSRRLGYLDDGDFRFARDGEAVRHNRYVMPRERWERVQSEHRAILGAEPELRGVSAFRRMVEPAADAG